MSDALGAAPALPLWRVDRILYDEDGLLIVDKPARIPVHGGDESLRHGLVERIGAYFESVGRPSYLGVHSRLDQETTGVLLFTTSEARNAAVAEAIEKKTLTRKYVALVELGAGVRLPESGTIRVLLRETRGVMEVVKSGGKEAVTHYRVLRRAGGRALVELVLETGRTHQIRVSLAHLGASVVGDPLYGGAPAFRLFLHAVELSGPLLPRVIESPLPLEFSEALSGKANHPRAGLRARVLDAALLRAPLIEKTSAFRLVNGEGDGLPGLTIDSYGAFSVVNIYDEAYRESLSELGELLRGLGYLGGYLKQRVRSDLRKEDAKELAPEGPWFGSAAPKELVVVEHGMKIAVDLADGLSSGLFLDQRDNRFRARTFAAGGRVLNLFCYTGSFSVATALAGAKTVSVDLAGRALERGKRNFELNELPLVGHSFFKEDAMKYLARALRRGDKFNFIVLDPPSFATVGKGTFSVSGRYEEAAEACIRLLAPGGRLLAVTNHEKTSLSAFRKMLQNAGRKAGHGEISLKSPGLGLDCPPGGSGPFPSKSLVVSVP